MSFIENEAPIAPVDEIFVATGTHWEQQNKRHLEAIERGEEYATLRNDVAQIRDFIARTGKMRRERGVGRRFTASDVNSDKLLLKYASMAANTTLDSKRDYATTRFNQALWYRDQVMYYIANEGHGMPGFAKTYVEMARRVDRNAVMRRYMDRGANDDTGVLDMEIRSSEKGLEALRRQADASPGDLVIAEKLSRAETEHNEVKLYRNMLIMERKAIVAAQRLATLKARAPQLSGDRSKAVRAHLAAIGPWIGKIKTFVASSIEAGSVNETKLRDMMGRMTRVLENIEGAEAHTVHFDVIKNHNKVNRALGPDGPAELKKTMRKAKRYLESAIELINAGREDDENYLARAIRNIDAVADKVREYNPDLLVPRAVTEIYDAPESNFPVPARIAAMYGKFNDDYVIRFHAKYILDNDNPENKSFEEIEKDLRLTRSRKVLARLLLEFKNRDLAVMAYIENVVRGMQNFENGNVTADDPALAPLRAEEIAAKVRHSAVQAAEFVDEMTRWVLEQNRERVANSEGVMADMFMGYEAYVLRETDQSVKKYIELRSQVTNTPFTFKSNSTVNNNTVDVKKTMLRVNHWNAERAAHGLPQITPSDIEFDIMQAQMRRVRLERSKSPKDRLREIALGKNFIAAKPHDGGFRGPDRADDEESAFSYNRFDQNSVYTEFSNAASVHAMTIPAAEIANDHGDTDEEPEYENQSDDEGDNGSRRNSVASARSEVSAVSAASAGSLRPAKNGPPTDVFDENGNPTLIYKKPGETDRDFRERDKYHKQVLADAQKKRNAIDSFDVAMQNASDHYTVIRDAIYMYADEVGLENGLHQKGDPLDLQALIRPMMLRDAGKSDWAFRSAFVTDKFGIPLKDEDGDVILKDSALTPNDRLDWVDVWKRSTFHGGKGIPVYHAPFTDMSGIKAFQKKVQEATRGNVDLSDIDPTTQAALRQNGFVKDIDRKYSRVGMLVVNPASFDRIDEILAEERKSFSDEVERLIADGSARSAAAANRMVMAMEREQTAESVDELVRLLDVRLTLNHDEEIRRKGTAWTRGVVRKLLKDATSRLDKASAREIFGKMAKRKALADNSTSMYTHTQAPFKITSASIEVREPYRDFHYQYAEAQFEFWVPKLHNVTKTQNFRNTSQMLRRTFDTNVNLVYTKIVPVVLERNGRQVRTAYVRKFVDFYDFINAWKETFVRRLTTRKLGRDAGILVAQKVVDIMAYFEREAAADVREAPPGELNGTEKLGIFLGDVRAQKAVLGAMAKSGRFPYINNPRNEARDGYEPWPLDRTIKGWAGLAMAMRAEKMASEYLETSMMAKNLFLENARSVLTPEAMDEFTYRVQIGEAAILEQVYALVDQIAAAAPGDRKSMIRQARRKFGPRSAYFDRELAKTR